MDEREGAWGRLHEAIPARWSVGRASYDPGARAWSITAVGPHPGRGKIPRSVTGRGADELAAVRDLDARLRGQQIEGPKNLDALRARLRLAYLTGAEGWSRENLGRGLTAEELGRVTDRFR